MEARSSCGQFNAALVWGTHIDFLLLAVSLARVASLHIEHATSARAWQDRHKISTQDRTHANEPRNEHTNADTKAHTKAHTRIGQARLQAAHAVHNTASVQVRTPRAIVCAGMPSIPIRAVGRRSRECVQWISGVCRYREKGLSAGGHRPPSSSLSIGAKSVRKRSAFST